MIRPGEPWGSPSSSAPDLEVTGGDADLARAIGTTRGALVRFRPDTTSDLARAVGLRVDGPAVSAGTELPMDVLDLGSSRFGCNMCVLGTPPDRLRRLAASLDLEIRLDGRPWFSGRATTVVIATGQFLRGLDVVPRGHPGDGKAEVQLYELGRRERRAMRTRLATGSHVPHPRIRQRSARTIEVRSRPPAPAELDGASLPTASELRVEVVPGFYRLLV